MGPSDPASHAFRGISQRNELMFGESGRLYVYRSHGLHWCANVVTGATGEASAVLLRAGRIVEGRELARARRTEGRSDGELARGPGNLCQALGVEGRHNGLDLLSSAHLTLRRDDLGSALQIVSGPRVGVSRAHAVHWRFWLKSEPSVSTYRRSGRITPASPSGPVG